MCRRWRQRSKFLFFVIISKTLRRGILCGAKFTAARCPEKITGRDRGTSRPGGSATNFGQDRPRNRGEVAGGTRFVLRTLARRAIALEAEVKEIDAILKDLVAETAPELVARSGLGTDTTSALLVAAGDNPGRLRNEASFAHLCGVAPIDANTGKQQRRHRLNRGGDRQANSALWTIAICRMAADQNTRDYINRRISDGLTKKEAIRCLKRHIAREVYHHLPRPQHAP